MVFSISVFYPYTCNYLIIHVSFFKHILGYFSYRRKAVGSWFFHDVINVFKSNYQDEHLEEMLIDVKEKLAYDEKRTIPEGYKQMLCTVSTLTKHFFLK